MASCPGKGCCTRRQAVSEKYASCSKSMLSDSRHCLSGRSFEIRGLKSPRHLPTM
jgi:hypothetical protein